MTSGLQMQANRENAKHSTGPRTGEGKAVCRLNATKHGLTARTLVLPGEDPKVFEDLRNRILEDLHPSSAVHEILAEHVVGLLWRLRRLGVIENGIFAWEWFSELSERAEADATSCRRNLVDELATLSETVKDEAGEARAKSQAREAVVHRNSDSLMLGCSFRRDAASADALSKLSRYQTSLERSLCRALRQLCELRASG